MQEDGKHWEFSLLLVLVLEVILNIGSLFTGVMQTECCAILLDIKAKDVPF